MPIVIPAGFRQITMVHDVPGAHGEMALVFGIESNNTELIDLNDFMDHWQNEIVEQFFTDNVTFVEGRALTGPRPGPPALIRAADPLLPVQGNQGSNALPINCATLVQLQT